MSGACVERLLPVTEPVGTLADYRAIGGGAALAEARERGPDWVLDVVRASGLRHAWGRDELVIAPASRRDRYIVGRNPYQVIEGLTIAAFATRARLAVIVVDESTAAEAGRLCGALDELADAGMLGPAPVRMVLEPHPHACDIQTLAQVPEILRRGPEWFRDNETTVYTVYGDVCRPGIAELPVGPPVEMLVELVGGGTPPGRRIRTVVASGPDEFVVSCDQQSSREVTGTAISTLVPSPGRERMVSDPPISSARSAMLFSP
jgi:NADH-quinone oxidoreductase subunit F